jgi:hypothetical protein
MKKTFKFITMLMVALATLMFTGCAEDGDPGPAGEQGEPGKKGEDGKDGEDGEDGSGFDEATQYGNVNLSFDGQRPDGRAFQKDINFKFAPVGVNGINTSSVVDVEQTRSIISIRRFYSTVAEGLQDNQIIMYVYLTNDDKPELINVDVHLRTVITTDDYKFFPLADSYEAIPPSNVKKFSYDPATGNLMLEMDFTVPGDYNGTRHDLHVETTANVKVFGRMIVAP